MKEILEWDDRPRKMWVWNKEDASDKVVRKVVHIITVAYVDKNNRYPVLTVDEKNRYYENYKHCADIDTSKVRRMTNKEFALWILEGIREGKLRQWRRINSNTIESVPCGYASGYENLFVENKLIRENRGEWHEPLVEVEE